MALVRARPTFALVALAFAGLSWQAASQQAVSPSFGAYIGCFDINYIQDVPKANTTSLSNCASACADDNKPLLMITTSSECHCTGVIPSELQKLNYTDCLEDGEGVLVFYQHADAGRSLCRLSNPPFRPRAWTTNYGDTNIRVNNGQLRVQLADKTGMSMQTKDSHRYGMFQFDAQVSGAQGVQTTYSVRTKDAANKSEVYWRFCNGEPCEQFSMYLSSLNNNKSNGELLIAPDFYQEKLGTNNNTGSGFFTYTINWQPNSLAWSVNDVPLVVRKAGDENTFDGVGARPQLETFEPPDVASYQEITIWTDPSGGFGGTADFSSGPYYSYFRFPRRIVCDVPFPTSSPQAQLALGPAWLYGRDETISPNQLPELLASFEKKDEWEVAPDESVPDPTNPEWVGLDSDSLGNGIMPNNLEPAGPPSRSAAVICAAAVWHAVLGVTALLALLYT